MSIRSVDQKRPQYSAAASFSYSRNAIARASSQNREKDCTEEIASRFFVVQGKRLANNFSRKGFWGEHYIIIETTNPAVHHDESPSIQAKIESAQQQLVEQKESSEKPKVRSNRSSRNVSITHKPRTDFARVDLGQIEVI